MKMKESQRKQRNEKLNDKVEPRSKQTKEIEEMKK